MTNQKPLFMNKGLLFVKKFSSIIGKARQYIQSYKVDTLLIEAPHADLNETKVRGRSDLSNVICQFLVPKTTRICFKIHHVYFLTKRKTYQSVI